MPLLYVVIIISVVVTGCQSLQYEEPMTGPRARVRFVTETKDITVLRMYDDTQCATNETEWMRLRDGFVIRNTPKVLGMPFWRYHTNAAKEVFVEANKLLYGLFVGSETAFGWFSFDGRKHPSFHFAKTEGAGGYLYEGTIYQCGTPFSFRFSEGKDYEVTFRWDRDNCSVLISQLAGNNDGPNPLEVARFDNRVSESNSGCLDAFGRIRFY